MDYKKLYEQALEKAKKGQDIESIFPELKENEDERIRKCVKMLINGLTEEHFVRCGASLNEIHTWLEKQSKQKHTNKVEPKFKVGDWITNDCAVWCIESIHNGLYNLKSSNGGVISNSNPKAIDNNFRLWTIQDAKDSDVLVAEIDEEPNDFIYIFKEYNQNLGFWSHCYLDAYTNKFHEGIYHNNLNVGVPATKEQRDLLFSKIKEAGYEWNSEKKELKKIDNEWIDLGLPSNTLWKSVNEEGYYTYDEAVEVFGDKLPTKEQFEELKENCVWEWKENGRKVTGPNGNSIFISALGFSYCDGEVNGVGSYGHYWSTTPYDSINARDLYFNSSKVSIYCDYHNYKFPIRLAKNK